MKWIKQLTDWNMDRFPDGAFDLFFAGRYHQLRGDNSKAIEHFERSISVQNEFVQLHNVAKWDLLWCYAMNCQWRRAADVASELRENCQWSPATNAYQQACFLYMVMEEEGRETELRPEIDELMASVETLRARYGGKTLPPEKFAITMAKRYCDGDRQMTLPALQLFYIWNVFGNCKERPELMVPFLDIINKKLTYGSDDCESYYVLLLLKGVCLRNARRAEDALECFIEIQRAESILVKERYVAPHAAMELGLSYMDVGNYKSSKFWLEKARDDYSGFLVETLVHLRIHGALQKLKELSASGSRSGSVVAIEARG